MPRKPSKKTIIEALRRSKGNIAVAAQVLSVSRGTVYNWIGKDPVYAKAISDGREELLDMAESKLFANVKKGKENSIFFALSTVGKGRGYIKEQIIKLDENTEIEIAYISDQD